MTTGRINQVTICGKKTGAHRPHNRGPPAVRRPPGWERRPRSKTMWPLEPLLQSLANCKPTEGDRAACGGWLGPTPELSNRCATRPEITATERLLHLQSGATPQLHVPAPGSTTTACSRCVGAASNSSASQAMPRPEWKTARGTPAKRSAGLRLCTTCVFNF